MARKDLTVEDWVLEIRNALAYRRQYGIEDLWADNEAMFYNVHPSSVHEGPNIIASSGDSVLGNLSVPEAFIEVSGRDPRTLNRAKILESLDNTLYKDLEIEPEVETVYLHAYLWGTGILKIGYDSEWGWDEEFNTEGPRGPEGFSSTQFDSRGNRIEFNSMIRPGMPWAQANMPHDFLVPWGTTRIQDAPWCAFRLVRRITDMKADKKYKNTSRLVGAMTMEDFVRSYQTTMKPYRVGNPLDVGTLSGRPSREAEFVELWEIHDRRTDRVKTISLHHGEFLRDAIALLPGVLPAVVISFVPKARSLWTTPDATYLQSEQAELTDIAIQALKQRRISVLQFVYHRDAIKQEELEKLLTSEVGIGAAIEPGHELKEAVKFITAQNNNVSLYNDAEHVRANAREVIGLSRNLQGEFEGGRHTAFEVGVVAQGSSRRMQRRRKAVAKFHEELFRKLNEIIFRKWTSPRWVEVIGEDGEAAFVQFVGAQLRDRYAYNVTFREDTKLTKSGEDAEALQLLAALAGHPSVNQAELANYTKTKINDPGLSRIFSGSSESQNASFSQPDTGQRMLTSGRKSDSATL